MPLGQRFTVAIYVGAFTCACSFTVRSVRGFLLIALSFSVIIRSIIVVLISPLNSRFSVMGVWAGAGCGGRGL